MESLAEFGILVMLAAILAPIIALIVFFVMAHNVGKIRNEIDLHLGEMNSTLKAINRQLSKEDKPEKKELTV